MHVLQVLGFPPDRIGGTEIYVAELSRELGALGVTVTLVAPWSEGERRLTEHEGFAVETYPVNASATPNELRGNEPHRDFEVFRSILARHPGALYHQHSWTRGCGEHHLHAAHEMGLATVLTMHMPSNLCMRGDMMRFGVTPCDGRIDPQTCAACWSHGKGAPKPLAQAISHLPLSLSQRSLQWSGKLATALSGVALASEKRAAAGRMSDDSDHIVAVSGWARDALAVNGVPKDKLSLNRQGVSQQFLAEVEHVTPSRSVGETLELLYLGSWNPWKGVDVVARAVRSLPADCPVRLSIHAPTGGALEQAYERQVREIAGGDPRITFHGPVDRASLARTMSAYDALVVPSVWMETGPLVVMEAQAAGLYVVGSRLGGIEENVGANAGLLVAPGQVSAWTDALRLLVDQRRGGGLARRPRPVRSMATVALEMSQIYRRLAA